MFGKSLARSYQTWMTSNKTFTFLISFLFPYEHRSNSITIRFYKLFTAFWVGKKHIERELSTPSFDKTLVKLTVVASMNDSVFQKGSATSLKTLKEGSYSLT